MRGFPLAHPLGPGGHHHPAHCHPAFVPPDVPNATHVEHYVSRCIAIAIGAMVDSAIIMVENAHKALEHWSEDCQSQDPAIRSHALTLSRSDIIIAAAKTVGRPLFFALLVITVSFILLPRMKTQHGTDHAYASQRHDVWLALFSC